MVVIKWFLLSLFITLNSYAQFDWFFGTKQKYYTYTPFIDTSIHYQTSNLMRLTGDYTKTKDVDKDSGGTRFVDYIKVWTNGLNDPLTYDGNTVFLYDGDVGLTTSAWADQSGNGYSLTLNNAPTITGTLNGYNTIYFNGFNENAQRFTTPVFTDSMTFYFVIKQHDHLDGAKIFRPTGGTGILQQDLSAPGYALATGDIRTNPVFDLDEWGIITVTRAGTTATIRVGSNAPVSGISTSIGGETGLDIAGWHPDEIEFAYIIGREGVDVNEVQSLFINFLGTRFALSGTDSIRGKVYNLPINIGNQGVKYFWQYYGFWKQKDKDTIWAYSSIDSLILPNYYDCQPILVDFIDITDAELNTLYSDSVIISGITCDSLRLGSDTEYKVGINGAWQSAGYFYVSDYDTVWLRATSSTEYAASTFHNLYVYATTSFTITWSITTGLPFIPTRVIISDDAGDATHRANTKQAFIDGYECIGGVWNDSIWIYIASLSAALSQTTALQAEIVIRSTTGMESYIPLAEAYTPDVMTFMPAGSNSYTQIYNSGGMLPDLIVTGAGDIVNETGYDIEFYSPDPITSEPDLSSFSNAYIAGAMMFLADTLNITLWQVRDTLRTRLGSSWTPENGYGLVNCDLLNLIVNNIAPNGSELFTPDGNMLYTSDGNKIYAKPEGI